MMEEWNDLRMLVARYLVASEQMERQGPVAQAVRSVGYRSDDEEEEDEDEEEGSSVEAEEEEEEGHAAAHAEGEHEEVPAYTNDGAAPVEVGPNGYALEKREKPESAEAAPEEGADRKGKSPARE